MNNHTRIHQDTTWLLNALNPLHHARIKGTPRPWKQTDLTPEQRYALDQTAREEKFEHGAFTLGESPAPLYLDILDDKQTITHTCKTIATTYAQWLQHAGALAYLTRVRNPNPTQLLTYIQTHTPTLEDADLQDIANTLTRLRLRTARHFAEVVSGQRLKTTCPWCNQEKLRFRAIGNHDNPDIVVRCESGICEPPTADCGTWTGKGLTLPTWPIHEWTWLARQLNHHDPAKQPAHA